MEMQGRVSPPNLRMTDGKLVATWLTHAQVSDLGAKAFVAALNRQVMEEHEADLAALQPEIRASRTPQEWLDTPPLEILRLGGSWRRQRVQLLPNRFPLK